MIDFAEKILSLRRKLGITQAELANKLGVTDKTVSKWERGLTLPDVSLIPEIARLFGISTDSLLGLTAENSYEEDFVSLEKYLMGDFGYRVPDLHPNNEEIILIMMSPDKDDSRHGVALSGKAGEAAYQFIFGKHMPSFDAFSKLDKLGVTYISNVPLSSPDKRIDPLVGELEYTRLGAHAINSYLLEKFAEKMTGILQNERISVIALENEFTKRYLGWFISNSPFTLLKRLQEKITCGKLRFLFVAPPRTWRSEEEKYDQAEFRRLIV